MKLPCNRLEFNSLPVLYGFGSHVLKANIYHNLLVCSRVNLDYNFIHVRSIILASASLLEPKKQLLQPGRRYEQVYLLR